jgi:hypothetical protein
LILFKILFWIVLAIAIYVYQLRHVAPAAGIGVLAACVFAADIWVAYRRPPADPTGVGELLDKPEWRVHKLGLWLMAAIALVFSATTLLRFLNGGH